VPLGIDARTWLIVLTGAGVSAESGVPTFRDAGGLWESHPIEDVATPEGFRRNPELVWRFYSARRRGAASVRPNPGHHALAAVEERLSDRYLLVTQNVDGLHRKAGSRRMIELHGSLFHTRCSECDRTPFPDESLHEGPPLPACDECAAHGRTGLLRPAVVWFGELLDMEHFARIDAFLQKARKERLVFLAAGTSGVVYPAAGLVHAARENGAETWLVNVEPPDNRSAFEHFVQGPSGRVLPELLGS
jgi:NAD-dependent deacetylase